MQRATGTGVVPASGSKGYQTHTPFLHVSHSSQLLLQEPQCNGSTAGLIHRRRFGHSSSPYAAQFPGTAPSTHCPLTQIH